MSKASLSIEDVREVDDAGRTHLEAILTTGQLVEFINDGLIKFEGNIRPDWRDGGRMLPKTKRKVERWAREILDGTAALGNLSIRVNPDVTDWRLVEDEDGRLRLEAASADTAVDAESRLRAVHQAHQANPALFNPNQRVAVRVYLLTDEDAARVGAAYNTRGDRVNDSAAKSAYQDTPSEKLAGWLLKQSGNPHLSSDNIEILSNTVSAASHKLAGFNTLVKAIEQEWDSDPVTPKQVEEMGAYISRAWEHLVAARPEFGLASIRDRRHFRDHSVGGSALGLYGAVAVIHAGYDKDLSTEDLQAIMDRLGPDEDGTDWLSKDNADWVKIGVLGAFELSDGTEVLRPRNSFQSRSAVAKSFLTRAGLDS